MESLLGIIMMVMMLPMMLFMLPLMMRFMSLALGATAGVASKSIPYTEVRIDNEPVTEAGEEERGGVRVRRYADGSIEVVDWGLLIKPMRGMCVYTGIKKSIPLAPDHHLFKCPPVKVDLDTKTWTLSWSCVDGTKIELSVEGLTGELEVACYCWYTCPGPLSWEFITFGCQPEEASVLVGCQDTKKYYEGGVGTA